MDKNTNKVFNKRGLLALTIVSAAIIIDQIIKVIVKLSMKQ